MAAGAAFAVVAALLALITRKTTQDPDAVHATELDENMSTQEVGR